MLRGAPMIDRSPESDDVIAPRVRLPSLARCFPSNQARWHRQWLHRLTKTSIPLGPDTPLPPSPVLLAPHPSGSVQPHAPHRSSAANGSPSPVLPPPAARAT